MNSLVEKILLHVVLTALCFTSAFAMPSKKKPTVPKSQIVKIKKEAKSVNGTNLTRASNSSPAFITGLTAEDFFTLIQLAENRITISGWTTLGKI